MQKSAQLKTYLDEIFTQAGGSLSFERYMELALYGPDFGYYSKNISDVGGSRADFSTWATLADLASPVAGWVKEEINFHDWTHSPISLIEIGAGDGSLASGVLKNFGWLGRRKLRYHIVEISAPLREKQAEKLKGKNVTWHESIPSAFEASQGRAIIFSNELVDAFPATWLRWNGAAWEEIFVSYTTETGLREDFYPCDMSLEWDSPPTGQRVELHRSYLKWLESWISPLHRGSMLTIDYGGAALEPIYERRLNGTMRGYFRQQRIEGAGIYQRFGQQDLTCDVNFGALAKHGVDHGLEAVRLEDQLSFMQRYGARDVASTEAARAFQVLHQRKV